MRPPPSKPREEVRIFMVYPVVQAWLESVHDALPPSPTGDAGPSGFAAPRLNCALVPMKQLTSVVPGLPPPRLLVQRSQTMPPAPGTAALSNRRRLVRET